MLVHLDPLVPKPLPEQYTLIWIEDDRRAERAGKLRYLCLNLAQLNWCPGSTSPGSEQLRDNVRTGPVGQASDGAVLYESNVQADYVPGPSLVHRWWTRKDTLNLLAGQERTRTLDPLAFVQAGEDVRRQGPPLLVQPRSVDP